MRIAFIGGGAMAEAMINGILAKEVARPSEVAVGELAEGRRAYLAQRFGVATSASNAQAASSCDLVTISVKPQNLPEVLAELRGTLRPSQAILSIVAGARMATIVQGLNHKAIIRVMPNTPAQVGAGMSVWNAAAEVPTERLEAARRVLQSFGQELYVADEKYLDMATALSASGPAYVFLFVEALIEGGVHIGMPREMARDLAIETVLGSAQMVKATGKHPAELKGMVASPGGTAVEGLLELEHGRVRSAIIKAVLAAYNKSRALGEPK
ncbi:MAG: pyrroline-5-carboxylate reductase [Chloroflexi bacterium]|nr:pyrroline-5-carboxylate reductase [Chloroflexota bacterium]